MNTQAILVVVLAFVLVLSAFQTIEIGNMKAKITSNAITGNSVASANAPLDQSDWTENEKMNYDMHGIIPSRAGVPSSSSGSGMVGGC